MSLTVTRARIKEKCAVTDSSYDSAIDNIITDYVAAIEFAIRSEYVADTGNSDLQATLNLAALEVCCGEFMAQRYREPGAGESTSIEGVSLTPFLVKSARDPSGLIQSGWNRLKPFLKIGMELGPISGVLSAYREVEA